MWQLAWPLIVAELGWMSQNVIDLMMAGPLGAAAIGGGTLANTLFWPIAVSGTAVLLGMDTLVAQAFGATDPEDTRKTLVSGIWLSLGITPVVAGALLATVPLMHVLGTNPRVFAQFAPYQKALTWSVLPLLLHSAFRRYLQAVNVVKPVTYSLIGANLVNIAGNWALMYGHWGAPAMGLEGSGWSTAIARLYMAGVLLAALVWHERKSGDLKDRFAWRPNLTRILCLVRLGLPAAMQIAIEGGVFG